MNPLLQQAFKHVSQLPAAEQDALARRIESIARRKLARLEADAKWDKTLEESADVLQKLAAEARAEYERGEIEPLDLERM